VQIEDREGLANVAEIAAVPGVDVVFVGPMDLSQALGYPARPEFRREVERAFEAAYAAGATTGTSGNAALGRLRRRARRALRLHELGRRPAARRARVHLGGCRPGR
jgi:2-keto-3-deoxy-L-rhamnonate aldolase RhmA